MGECSEEYNRIDRSELNPAEHQRERFLLCILRGRFWSIAGCRVSSKEPGFPIDVPDQTKFRWDIQRQRLIYSEGRRFFTVVYVHPSTILIQSEAFFCHHDEPESSVVRAWDINFKNSLLSAKFMFRWMAELRAASGDLVQTQRNLERDQETLWDMRAWEAGDHGGDKAEEWQCWQDSLKWDWSDESRNQPLTEELLRRHDEFFGVPSRSGQADANSVGASSAFSDRYEKFKEQANQALVHYHGAHDGSSQALYLDGRRLRTTNTLVEAGWPPTHLHIPNDCPRDFACIQTALRDAKQPVNVYELSSSQFLGHQCIQIWARQQNPEEHPELPRASSPFSLVYLDYTTNKHRHNDLEILLKRKLFTCGVLAVTCPESTHGISVDDDRHRMEERKQRIRIPSGLAGMDWHVGLAADFPCAGLFKMFFFWTTCDAACCSAFTYTGRGRRTRMWFALFQVQLCGDIQAEPGFALPTKLLKRELCLFLFLRASKRNPAEKFLKEVEELSWKELQSLSRADFPTLWALVDFVRRVDK